MLAAGSGSRLSSRRGGCARAGARRASGLAALRWLVVALLFWAPLPLGSNRPWSWSLLAVSVGLSVLAWCVLEVRRPRTRSLPAPIWLAAGLIGGAMGWACAQTVSGVPADHPIWHWAASDYGLQVRGRPSLDPFAGRAAVLQCLSYIGVFWICFVISRDRQEAGRLLAAILFIVVTYAVWGLVRLFAGIEHLFWHVASPYPEDLTATFVNRNHAATYLGLGVVVAVALLWQRLASRVPVRARGAWLRRVGGLMEHSGVLVLAALGLIVATLLTGSRGGLLSLGTGLITVLCLGLLKSRAGVRAIASVAGLAALIALGLLRLGGEVTLERLGQIDQEVTTARENRLTLWQNCLELIRERPLAGHGYGTFEQLFLLTRDARFERVWHTAHNTYLEHAVELGLPASAALYGGLFLLVAHCVRGVVRRRRDQAFPIAAVGATVLVATHALVDFSLQIPAIAVTYAAVLGIGCAQAIPSAEYRGRHPIAAG